LDYSDSDFSLCRFEWQGDVEKTIYTEEYEAVLELLRALRQQSGITQVELAELLGQSQSYVSKVERGDRRLDVIQLRTICQTLGTSLPSFIDSLEKRLQTRRR